jgi:hypothetical protein
MKAKEFIENKLNYLYHKFNDIKIRYEYRVNTSSHLIEIIPLSFFEKDMEYMVVESEIEDEFETKFPNENILFISEGSLSEIINPDLLFGYNEIKFDNDRFNMDFIFEGFNSSIEFQNVNNYALAA